VIYLNDKPVPAREGLTLGGLLEGAGLDPALVVVTVDGKFVPRPEYRSLVLADGARVRAWNLLSGG